MIRTLIVDDDEFTRIFIRNIIEMDSTIQVIGEAGSGEEALQIVKKLKPDVVTMDVMMPQMDGLEATKRIMSIHPCPIIMVSEITQEDSDATVKAMALGAVDFVSKSSNHLKFDIPSVRGHLVKKILYWGNSHNVLPTGEFTTKSVSPKLPVDGVVVYAAAGGPQSLPRLFVGVSRLSCPLIVAQVMPEIFSKPFVDLLQSKVSFPVVMVRDGSDLTSGTVYVAPGGKDIAVYRESGRLKAKIFAVDESKSRPSPVLLFASVAREFKSAVGVVLSGKDGNILEAVKPLRDKGWPVIVQDSDSCVESSSPHAVLSGGMATEKGSPEEIGKRLAQWMG